MKRKVFVICCTIVIIIIISIVIIYTKNSSNKNIDINGISKLKNLDVETYDVKALSMKIEDNEIKTLPIYSSDNEEKNYNIYNLTNKTKYYKRIIKNDINDAGEVISKIDYEVIKKADIIKILEKEQSGIITYFWIDDSKNCLSILVSYE